MEHVTSVGVKCPAFFVPIRTEKTFISHLCICLLILFRSPIFGEMASDSQEKSSEFSELAESGLKFTLDLHKHCEDGNLFMSPFSISITLAMTLAGAKSTTANEMKNVLKLNQLDDKTIHSSFKEASKLILQSVNPALKLHLANRMYLHDTTKLLPEFTNSLQQNYNSSASQADFKKETEKIRLEINKWVEEQTMEKIKNLLAPGILNEYSRLVLVNAIYFKGDWVEKFDSRDTVPQDFFITAQEKIKVDMMRLQKKFAYGESEELHSKILELPYVNRSLSMFVILPNEVDGLSALEGSLNIQSLRQVIGNMTVTKVIVTLPKFKLESELTLSKILKEMGMRELFDERADLSGMTGTKELCVSEVVHKAFLEVNEEGSEAAAATAGIMMLKRSIEHVEQFRVDHPFLLFIRENRSGNVLFWGRIVNPGSVSRDRDEL